jgi:RimJ/RimL family protein N-acetyltransferase
VQPPTIDLGLPGWRLRAWRADDAPALARHADDAEVWRWMNDAFPHPYTLGIAEHWIRQGHLDFGGDHWAIDVEGQSVGGCGIHPLDGAQRCVAEVGWWLGRAFWGRGVGSRAARAIVARAFDDPQIARVVAPIFAGNERSMAVARKAGLALEAVQRQSMIKAGRVIDCHLHVAVRHA